MPLELAREHSALVANGAGVIFPGEAPVVIPRGIVSYQEFNIDWPIEFRLGLRQRIDNGFIVYPISIQLDDETGDAVFVNAEGEEFYSIEPLSGQHAATWLQCLHGIPGNEDVPPYRRLSHVITEWTLVPEACAVAYEEYLEAGQGDSMLRGSESSIRSLPRTTAGDTVANLCLTSLEKDDDFTWLELAWPTNMVFTEGVVDVWCATSLVFGGWSIIDTESIPTGTNELLVAITNAFLPGHVDLSTYQLHDDNCAVATNEVENPFEPGVTNRAIVYTCGHVPPRQLFFFRLGTHDDGDGDGLLDADELFNWHTSITNLDTDADGISDGIEAAMGTNPLSIDTDCDGMPDGFEIDNGLDPNNADDALSDDDADGLPAIYEYHAGTCLDLPDYDCAPKIIAGGNGADSVPTLGDALDVSWPFSIIEVAPGVHSGPGWSSQELPGHPVLLTSPNGGRSRQAVLVLDDSGFAVLYSGDGQDARTVVQGLVFNLCGKGGFQTAFWIGGSLPYVNEGAAGGTFRDIYIHIPAPGQLSCGWFIRHWTASPITISGCTIDAAGVGGVRGIYAVDSPPLLIEHCSFVNFPQDPTPANFAIQVESTAANWGGAPSQIPVFISDCLFDETFTNALPLARLEDGSAYFIDMDTCIVPSALINGHAADAGIGVILTNALVATSAHLQAMSPAIGAAIEAECFSKYDVDGQPRSQAYDIGSDAFSPIDPLLDTDGDGLTDVQEISALGTQPFLPDSDGDGIGDRDEIESGTDPLNSFSFDIHIDVQINAPFKEFDSLAFAVFDVSDTTTNHVSSLIAPTGEVSVACVDLTATNGCAGMCAYVWNDYNTNGFVDVFEPSRLVSGVNSGTNSCRVTIPFSYLDFDNDGMPDGWEWRGGLNPADATDAYVDIDRDWLVNLHEYWMDCDPQTFDGTNALLSIFARSVDERIAGRDPTNSLARFTDYFANGSNCVFVANTNFWAADVDFSCANPWTSCDHPYSQTCTLIGTRLVTSAYHWHPPINTSIYFVGANGEVVTNRIVNSTKIDGTDIYLGLLEFEMPSNITPAMIPPADYKDYIGQMQYTPTVTLNQFEKAILAEGWDILEHTLGSQLPKGYFRCRHTSVDGRDSFCGGIIGGDSTSPRFLLALNEPILLNTIWKGDNGSYGEGTLLSEHISSLQQKLNALNPNCTIEVADWSSYPKRVHGDLK